LDDHLANLRDGLTGFDTSGFSANAPGVDPLLSSVRSHLLAWNPAQDAPGLVSDSPAALFGGGDAKEMKPAVNTQPVDRWSTFISGSVILASLDNTFSNTGDAGYTTGSVMAGADYRLDDHFTAGVLFDYSHTGADLDGNSSRATVDSYLPGVYGSYVNGPWYANALAAYGFNRDKETRNVDIPGIAGGDHAAADGGQVSTNLTGGYECQSGPFKFGPVATLQYVHLHVDSFNESGPSALTVGSQDDDSLRTELGFEGRYSAACATCYGPMTFTPHVQASWQHEYLDNSDGITAAFNGAGGGSFVVQGGQPERDSAFFEAGLDAGITSNITLFVDYQAQAGQADFFAQSAQGGLRIGF
jgi:outer membrane autotransporter protein